MEKERGETNYSWETIMIPILLIYLEFLFNLYFNLFY